MLPYLNVMGTLSAADVDGWDTQYFLLNNIASNFSNNSIKMYLNDGTKIIIDHAGNNENAMVVYIDINGNKKPNKKGKDIFYYRYNFSNGQITPDGLGYTRDEMVSKSNRYSCTTSGSGNLCAALIMKDGWRIADDYPW